MATPLPVRVLGRGGSRVRLAAAGQEEQRAGDGHGGGETQAALRLSVVAGQTYTVRGACDRDCRDLDLVVTDGAGNEVGADRAVDDYPTVTFTARQAGQYVISAVMAQCSEAYCYYGVLALAR